MVESRVLSRVAAVVDQYDLKKGHVAVVLLALFLTWYAVTTVVAYWRLRHFKGPPFAAWSGLWLIKATVGAQPHLIMGDVCTKYGSLARIGPNHLLTSDEELIKKMNGARSKYSRGIWYKAFKFGADRENLLSEPDEVKHNDMRKRVAPGYTGKDNPTLEPDLDGVIFELINLIERKYISSGADSRPFDFATISQYFTIDVITQLSLGKALGFLKNDEDMFEYSATLGKNLPVMNFISSIPALIRFIRLPIVQGLMLPSVKDKIGVGAIKGRIRDIVDDRFADSKDSRNDMVLSFMNHGLTPSEIIDESMLQLFAGSDTTSTVLRTGLLYIITNTRVYKRLREECDALNVPLSSIISNSQAIEQPYLAACVKESLRYHPAGTGMLPRVVPPEGDYHNGQFLPGGTEIACCAWNVFRHNEAYGPDCSSYRPERWLESSPEQLVRMEKAHDLVFGYGRYKCLGEKTARMELFKVFFELVRRFDMSLVDSMVPVEHNENHGVFVQRGMWMRVEERKDK